MFGILSFNEYIDATARIFTPSTVEMHEDYDRRSVTHDIAILSKFISMIMFLEYVSL